MTKRRVCLAAVLTLLVLSGLSGCGSATQPEEKEKSGEPEKSVVNGVIPWDMGFLAAGDYGMLFQITVEGTCREIPTDGQEDLFGIWSGEDDVYLAGENGVIYHGDTGLSFEKEDTGCREDLNVGVEFQGRQYCGGDKGTVLYSSEDGGWERCRVQIQGNVTGIEVSGDRCLLVTDAGEAAVTENGEIWSVLDYGQYYGEKVSFKGLTYSGGNFWAYGDTDEGTGLFYSVSGAVWSKRDINYLEGSNADLGKIKIRSILSDGQQIYVWCQGGMLYTFPDCVQCNKETEVEGLLSGAAAYSGGKILIAEDPKHIKILDTDAAKQYRISAETACQMQQEGAVLIDVRSEEEHRQKAIEGSVSIPLEELEERLPEEYPDFGQVLIFYCSKGIRSQSAVEKARALGYVEIYSMGSIDEWDFGIQGQED